MSDIQTALMGYLRYRGQEGHWAFLLHRITGLGTLTFLTVHILDTALVYFNPTLYLKAIELYRSTLFGIGEIILVFCVFYHGINGLRIAFFDLLAPKYWEIPSQRTSIRLTLALTLLLWLPATVLMLRSLLIHNFGLGEG